MLRQTLPPVDADGEVEDYMVLHDPDDPNACPCHGDIANAFQQPPADGLFVDLGDLNYLISELAQNDWYPFAAADRPGLRCADVASSFQLPPGDGWLSFGDINLFIYVFKAHEWLPFACVDGGFPQPPH